MVVLEGWAFLMSEVVRSALPALAQRKEYTLMTPYPRKVFVGADLEVSLSAACLVPAATLNVTRVPNV
ncbi:hypothetical protein T484DRAFT_1792925 [Baffinella frigidus]|nr:hypothetical protein T484DRAFT_1792925 [Cryptophyta sp. CCMP2293]